MDANSIVLLGAFFVALGIALIYITITQPARIPKAQKVDPQREVKLARSIPGSDAFAAMSMDLGDAFAALFGLRAEDEESRYGSAIVQLLKAADWYWEYRQEYPPTPEAPFWNLATYWSAKGAYALLYAVVGLVAGTILALVAGFVWAAPVGFVLGGVIGFLEPDDRLTKAARARQDMMTIELGFSVPKLYSIVQNRGSLVEGLRDLVSDGGGPFIEEIQYVLRVYGVARNLGKGFDEMVARNTNVGVREFCLSMKMVGDKMGGDPARAVAKQSELARDAMQNYVASRSDQNKAKAGSQSYQFMTALLFLMLIIPIALVVAQSLVGGSVF